MKQYKILDEFYQWLKNLDVPEMDGPPMQEQSPWSMEVSEDSFLELDSGEKLERTFKNR